MLTFILRSNSISIDICAIVCVEPKIDSVNIFAVVLRILFYFRGSASLSIGLADLSVWQYLIMIALIFCTGNLETRIWYSTNNMQGRVYVTIVMILVLSISGMNVFINVQNLMAGTFNGRGSSFICMVYAQLTEYHAYWQQY